MQPGTAAHGGIVRRFRLDLLVLLVASCIFLPLVVSPPHLMDDVDAVQAQVARNMLESGDWVTARLDGVPYLEKSPLIYWIMAASFKLLGVHDWSARLPLALINIALCWITAGFGRWAFGQRAGIYAGIILATCVGMFLFTRILIPDAALTLTIAVALWAFLRLQEGLAAEARGWFFLLYASLGCGLLLKGLIAAIFPLFIIVIYLVVTRQLGSREVWRNLRPFRGLLVVLLVAAPWHLMAVLRNPPHFDWTMHSAAGEYHGFFWFYFLNEHVFRFLNMRYPRDYNTVPRAWFWLLHFAWLFPWSATLVTALRCDYRPGDRAGKTRLLALIWTGFVLLFFTLSTTQEYYSLPLYPALALLIGSDLAARENYPRAARLLLVSIFAASLAAVIFLLVRTANYPAPGDISSALSQNPALYTLSLGHMGDLTLRSFAYLRAPLVLAGCALAMGVLGLGRARKTAPAAAVLVMVMIFFVQAARLALVVFDPYLGSWPLAAVLLRSPPGILIEGDAYYAFSSVFFYTNRKALLWNGRNNNLEYGSYAPGAPRVFIDDEKLGSLWRNGQRAYLLVYGSDLSHLQSILGNGYSVVAASGGNYLLSNQGPAAAHTHP